MAAIYLIRHGQASFGKADYDQLSDIGSKQAEMLGEYWQPISSSGKIYSGDLLRHGQTLEHFFQGYQSKPSSFTLHSGFNEFNHVDILACYDSQWQNFADMAASIGTQANANKVFQKEFARALERWVSGKHDPDYKESWNQFKKRCVSALQDVIKQELTTKQASTNTLYSKDIYVFTSGGTIAVLIQHILGLSDEKTLVINQQLRNTSVTKLLFSENDLNIDYFNNYSHLTSAGADWVTFR
ncbi:MAG: phosphoglycerate kinase [Gammaproteobacteria bacterium]|nr:MAG: phosphoglycerate kinase [Gammaproteobacteria bacterium]